MRSVKEPHLRERMRARLERGRARLKAVLHPLAGRKLPKKLRAENVVHLAASWVDGVRSAEFEQLVGRIDTGPIHQGDRIAVYHRGPDALAAVRTAIEQAQEEVLLETYILKDDDTGRGLLGLLADAVRRGLKVRVLADAAGSWATKRRFWRQMESQGIETRLFHPLIGRFRDLLLRDHRKIIVVDRRIAFTGGMNIGNEYAVARRARGERVWRDSHVRLEGSAAWEMAVVFNESWVRAGGKSLKFPSHSPAPVAGPKTIVLDCRSGRGHQETAAVLVLTMAAARTRLWVTNAYFAPHPRVLHQLIRAARRGVDVRLLLPAKSDMPIVRRAGHGSYARLLASGVRIYEYQPTMLHAKTLVVDDWAAMIGSSNLDYRSYYFNAECNVLILDAEIGQGMAETFQEDLRHTVEITLEKWRQRSLFKKIGDGLARSLSPLL
jgi:cardiolipin synthase A/B